MIVTIITVVKNDSKNILKTINSVYNQTYKRIEYIIIDGNSKDKTLSVIKNNKKKISKIYSEVDKNLYDALNKGIKRSKGQIVGILHSGYVYTSNDSIKKSIEILRKENLDFVLSNLKVVDKNNKVFRNVTISKYFRPFMLSLGIQPPHPTLFIRKNIIKAVNYYSTNYKIVGDFDFFCKIFKKNYKWKSFDKTTINQVRGGLSDGQIKDKISMANDMSKILKKNNFFSLKVFFIFKFFLRIKEIMIK